MEKAKLKEWGERLLKKLEKKGEWNLTESIDFVKNVVRSL